MNPASAAEGLQAAVAQVAQISPNAAVKSDAKREEWQELDRAGVLLEFGFLGRDIGQDLLAYCRVLTIRSGIRKCAGSSSEIEIHLRISYVSKADLKGNTEMPLASRNRVSKTKGQLRRETVKGHIGGSCNRIRAAALVHVAVQCEVGPSRYVCICAERDSVVQNRSRAYVKLFLPRGNNRDWSQRFNLALEFQPVRGRESSCERFPIEKTPGGTYIARRSTNRKAP